MHLQGQQFAGELTALQTNVLNYLKIQKIDFEKVIASFCFQLAILTHSGIGFLKMLCLCTMISILVGLPPLIKKSPCVASLPSSTRLILTCFNSCSTIQCFEGRDLQISGRVWSKADWQYQGSDQKTLMYKDGTLLNILSFYVHY